MEGSDSSSSPDNKECDLIDSDTNVSSSSDDDASDRWSETDSDEGSTSPSELDEDEENANLSDGDFDTGIESDDIPFVLYEYDNPSLPPTEEIDYKKRLRNFTTSLGKKLTCYLDAAARAGIPGHLPALLKFWRQNPEHWRQNKYIYKLENQYSSGPLRADHLRASDKSLVEALHGTCSRNGYQVLPGQMERTQTSLNKEARHIIGESVKLIAEDREAILHIPITLNFIADFISLTSENDECSQHATDQELLRTLLRRIIKKYCKGLSKKDQQLGTSCERMLLFVSRLLRYHRLFGSSGSNWKQSIDYGENS